MRSRLFPSIGVLWLGLHPAPAQMSSIAIGHEFQQDDWPSLAAAPDGSLWAAWLSFSGERDDVIIRRFHNGRWGSLQWVPGTSGDSFLPQVSADSSNRVWVVWSQQVNGNWDLYARRFDPAGQDWGPLERLTTDPLPDINPRLASDGKGHFALVWQAFRQRNSNIFLKTFDGEKWSGELRVTNRTANDWEPAAAFDSQGTIWIAYDSYKNGNYDVFLSKVKGGKLDGAEMIVADSARFEARASVAVDTQDRVWVAWESGRPNWGKDQGYILRANPVGVPLGAQRVPHARCFADGQWREPEVALAAAFTEGNTHAPQVFSDGRGSVWVAAKTRVTAKVSDTVPRQAGYWEYRVAHLTGAGWAPAITLPNSKGRSSTRLAAALTSAGALALVWPTDNRQPGFYHRPVRQQLYAGTLPAPESTLRTAAWKATAAAEALDVKPGHINEPADVRAVRAYTATIGGKPHHIVRGDFHRHTELSWDGGGTNDGSLQDFYRYMIDAAQMDFGASTDHQGGAWLYWWWYTQKMTDMYHVPRVFVPIFGYERSVTFPNGHRNIFYARRSDSRVVPFFLKEGLQAFSVPVGPQGDEPGIGTGDVVANDTRLLYEEIRRRRGIAISHTSGTRMGTDWRDNDPALEPVVEIYQGARTNYESLGAPFVADEVKDAQHVKQAGYHAEGMVSNAWAKGYKLGIITSSDHGSTHLSYAMVYTDNPTRQGILDAIRRRHTYGAMDNIILEVRMGEHFMGDEFPLNAAQPLSVKVRGTRAIARVDVIKDNKSVYSTQPKSRAVAFEFIDKGPVAGRHFYYVRIQQEDNMLAWSSPMFVHYR